jgi:hypothetical protein
MMMISFLARTVPVMAILIGLGTFGNTGGLVAVLAILVGMMAWATVHRAPAPTVEYDFD